MRVGKGVGILVDRVRIALSLAEHADAVLALLAREPKPLERLFAVLYLVGRDESVGLRHLRHHRGDRAKHHELRLAGLPPRAPACGLRPSADLVLDPAAYHGADYGAEDAATASSQDPAYARAYPAHCSRSNRLLAVLASVADD